MLLKNSIIVSSKVNVMSFDEQCTGSLFSLKWTKHWSPINEQTDHKDCRKMNDEVVAALSENLDRILLSGFIENILYYIAGYIVRHLIKKIDCSECAEELVAGPTGYQD